MNWKAILCLSFAVGSCYWIGAASAQMMDGNLVGDEAFYGTPVSVQNTDTGFGNATQGDQVDGLGNEIDQVFARIHDGRLYMLIAGNLNLDFTKMEIFFDTVDGGSQTIDGSMLPEAVDDCPPCGTPGALQQMNGFTFDDGFEPDYYLTFSHGFEDGLDDPSAPGNPITFWATNAHYSDLTPGAPADRQNVAAGMQLAPQGLPNVLRFEGSQNFDEFPYLPNINNGTTVPNHIGPQLPNLEQGELIDRAYALDPAGGQCSNDEGTDCLATELGFALDVAPSDPDNLLDHRNYNNLVDLRMAFDNSNTEGVNDGSRITMGNPESVTTGLELSIPMSEIGNPTGDFKATVFINGTVHNFASNQFAGDGVIFGNLGPTSGVNLPSIVGNQFITIPNSAVLACDFDGSGSCDIDDIDMLTMEIAMMGMDDMFDLNNDMVVDELDIAEWLVQAGADPANSAATSGNPFLAGDFNLDGFVDGQDFIIWNGEKFTSTGKWSLGDANGDGFTDGQDFIIWNGNKFLSSADGLSAVPEPGSLVLLGMALAFLGVRRSS